MAVTLDQLGKAIVASGLLSADEVKSIWSALPAAERPRDGDSLAKLLVEHGKLNGFQAQELLSDSGTPLVLGDYVLIGKIGAGGMGQVFQARHRVMDRLVAVKLLPKEMVKDDAAVRRFHREVKAAARLAHPNIVQAYDASMQRGMHYLVMEYVDGRDLAAVLKERYALPVPEALNYVLQAARGLAYAHAEGVVHRDIKPGNLLLDKRGIVKILDMGLARFDATVDDADRQLTNTGAVMGTVDYMAPEQAQDTHAADARSDIYSLGCTLHRLLTGRSVYSGDSPLKKILAHCNAPIPSLADSCPDAPAEVERIFQRMVAKRPEDRYQRADDLIAEFQAVLQPAATAVSTRPAGGGERSVPTVLLPGGSASPAPSTVDDTTTNFHPEAPTHARPMVGTTSSNEPAVRLNPAATDRKRGRVFAAAAAGCTAVVVAAFATFLPDDEPPPSSQEPVGAVASSTILPNTPIPVASGKPTAMSPATVATRPTPKPASTVPVEHPTPADFEPENVAGLTPYEVLTSPDFEWTEPVDLGPLVNEHRITTFPSLSGDGLTLVFESTGENMSTDRRIWMARREQAGEPFGAPILPGPEFDVPYYGQPTLSGDGKTMIFSGGRGPTDRFSSDLQDIWQAMRTDVREPFGPPVLLKELAQDGADTIPVLFYDGLTLIYKPAQGPAPATVDGLCITQRSSLDSPFGELRPFPVPFLTEWNTPQPPFPSFSSDGRVMIFSRSLTQTRKVSQLFMIVRDAVDRPFGEPIELPLVVNGTDANARYTNMMSTLSGDGTTLIFASSNRTPRSMNSLWQTRRVRKRSDAVATNSSPPGVRPSTPTPGASPSSTVARPVPRPPAIPLPTPPVPVWSAPAPGIQPSPYEVLTSNDWVWTEPELLRLTGTNSSSSKNFPALTGDGLSLIYTTVSSTTTLLKLATRTSVTAPFSDPVDLNPEFAEMRPMTPALSGDGLTLVFSSDFHTRGMPLPNLSSDLWTARRQTRDEPFGKPELIPELVGEKFDTNPCLSHDGLSLLYFGFRAGITPTAGCSLLAQRPSLAEPFDDVVPFAMPPDSGGLPPNPGHKPIISSDGRVCIFARPQPKSMPGMRLCMSTRERSDQHFGPAVSLGRPIDGDWSDSMPTLSADGRVLVFASMRPRSTTTDRFSTLDLWQTRRVRRSEAEPVPTNYGLTFSGTTMQVRTPIKYDGKTPLTVEAWVKPKTTTTTGKPAPILADGGLDSGFMLDFTVKEFRWLFAGPDGPIVQTAPILHTTTARYHVAGVFDGRAIHLFVNGKHRGSQPATHHFSGLPICLGTSPSMFGPEAAFYSGIVDEVRISRTVRYTADFEPALRHEPDADTLALYHCEEGDLQLLDDSGNNRHADKVLAQRIRIDDLFGP